MGNTSIIWFTLLVVVLGQMCSQSNSRETPVKASKCEKSNMQILEKACITDRHANNKPTVSDSIERAAQDLRDKKTLQACCDQLKRFATDDIAATCLCKTFQDASDGGRLTIPAFGLHLEDVDLCNLDTTEAFHCDDD